MSRRFGRNQRRRAREAMAQANDQLEQTVRVLEREQQSRQMTEALARDYAKRAETLKDLLGKFASRVGRYAIAEGVPAKFTADWLGRMSQFRLPVMPEFDASTMFRNSSMYDTMTICDEVMRVLDVEVVRNHMKRDMHVRVDFDDIPMGYAISEHALRHLPRTDLVEMIARDIATALVHKLKEERL